MTTYISVLRGINVSGQKKILMKDLKALYEKLGFENVITYIQSGNVLFQSNNNDPLSLAKEIEQAINDIYSFSVPVQIRSRSEIQSIVTNCPFGNVDLVENGTKVMLTFFNGNPSEQNKNSLLSFVKNPDELHIADNEVYFYCPNGYGKTKLNNNFVEKKLALTATTRNWKTIIKLLALSSD